MKSLKFFSSVLIASALAATAYAATTSPKATSEAFGTNIQNTSITEAEVQSAQEAWGKALIQIGKDFEDRGAKKATATANAVLDAAYGYNMGPVLFKPTLTTGDQTFRTTKEGALAYFVGGNKKFPNDSGFALKVWRDFKYQNAAVHIDGRTAMTMGKVHLTNKDGTVTTVDKTWGFKKDDAGKLRIVLHHSSLPYTATK